ncbi:MarR family EPS-associated transcriptional regulator [Yoonia sp. GPGPB17]|uniref:MarR family EPS-associated transcriptional regulator n=1 Tax=Yoonia sp. GPGPB17 TaxID=3026147 RepID=UPI0030C3E931
MCLSQITAATSGGVAMGRSEQHVLSDRAEIRFRVMQALQDNPKMSQRALSRKLGVSLGGVNYCIRALIEKGAIKVENFRASNNKKGYAYILTPEGLTQKGRLTRRFLQRKIAEYETLKAEISRLEDELRTEDQDG